MPGYDGTGPKGFGSGSGKRKGKCKSATDTMDVDSSNLQQVMKKRFGAEDGTGPGRGLGRRKFTSKNN